MQSFGAQGPRGLLQQTAEVPGAQSVDLEHLVVLRRREAVFLFCMCSVLSDSL